MEQGPQFLIVILQTTCRSDQIIVECPSAEMQSAEKKGMNLKGPIIKVIGIEPALQSL